MPDEIRDINVSVLDDQSESSHTKGYKIHYNDDRIIIGTQAEIDEIPLEQKNGKVVIITDEAEEEGGETPPEGDEAITLTIDTKTETITFSDLKLWLEEHIIDLLYRSKHDYTANSQGVISIGQDSLHYGGGLPFYIHFTNSNPEFSTNQRYDGTYDAIRFSPNYIVEGRAIFTCTLNSDKDGIETVECLGVAINCNIDKNYFRQYVNVYPLGLLKKTFADMNASELNQTVFSAVSNVDSNDAALGTLSYDGGTFYAPLDLWTIRKFPGSTVISSYSLTSQQYYGATSFNGVIFFSRKTKTFSGNTTELANSVGYEIYMLVLDWARDNYGSESSNISYGGGRLYKITPPLQRYNTSDNNIDVWDGSENVWAPSSCYGNPGRGVINQLMYWNINENNSSLTFDQLIQTTPTFKDEIATKSDIATITTTMNSKFDELTAALADLDEGEGV